MNFDSGAEGLRTPNLRIRSWSGQNSSALICCEISHLLVSSCHGFRTVHFQSWVACSRRNLLMIFCVPISKPVRFQSWARLGSHCVRG